MPKLEIEAAKASRAPAMMLGDTRGRVTSFITFSMPAPAVLAASSRVGSILSKAPATVMKTKG